MNILLTSVGRRSYLVKYFKEALDGNGQVHVSNSNDITPAFNQADKSVVTPLIYDKSYIPFLLKYCKENEIDAVISLFDIDLPILSANKQYFEEMGTSVVISDESVVEICNDKLKTYNFLVSNGFNTPRTLNSLSDALEAVKSNTLKYPLIIKPRWGMGSIGVFKANNEEELIVFYNKVLSHIKNTYLKYESLKNLEESVLIQEKLHGQEHGLDIINDLSGNYQNTIVKKKYAMRSGETDCAEVISNPKLKNLGELLSKKLQHIANLDVDVFLSDNVPYILEINARFGGGYPFSHIAGVNLPLAIVNWLQGKKVNKTILTEQTGVLAHKDISITKIQSKNKEKKETRILSEEEDRIIRLESKEDIVEVLNAFDNLFNPSISQRISNFDIYVEKLKENAFVYSIKNDKEAIGFVAFYANDEELKTAYLVFIAVQPFAQKRNYGKTLLELCINISKEKGMKTLKLEVRKHNHKAIRLYKNYRFEFCGKASEDSIYMIRKL